MTIRQESAIAAALQHPELHGPPAYFTPDWRNARRSVEALAELAAETFATGHGPVLRGAAARAGLHRLARNFRRNAVPARGRYVNRPAATDATGMLSVPPPVSDPFTRAVIGGSAGLAAGLVLAARSRRR